jgi:hypothetical protein
MRRALRGILRETNNKLANVNLKEVEYSDETYVSHCPPRHPLHAAKSEYVMLLHLHSLEPGGV